MASQADFPEISDLAGPLIRLFVHVCCIISTTEFDHNGFRTGTSIWQRGLPRQMS